MSHSIISPPLSQVTFYAHRAVMAVSSEFFAARVNDSVVRLDDSVEPQEFKVLHNPTVSIIDLGSFCVLKPIICNNNPASIQALLHFIYHGEMRDCSGPREAERVEALGRSLGVRWFSEESRAGGGSSRRKRHRPARTPSPARNEDAEISNGDEDSGKSDEHSNNSRDKMEI